MTVAPAPTAVEWYIERLYTVTAGTPATSLLVVSDSLGDVWVYDVNVRIPPGHCGQTGFQIVYADSVLVPWNDQNAFLIDDDKDYDFTIGMEFDQSLTLQMFNMGAFDHTFYVRWHVTPVSSFAGPALSGLGPIVQPSTSVATSASEGGP